jgi:tetrathionate reductase subunit B
MTVGFEVSEMKCLVVDVNRCNGCYNCQLACKDEHVENDWTPYAKPQPDTGHFWMRVEERERGTIPKVRVAYIPRLCVHCADAPCMKAARGDAMYRRPDGVVIIDPVKAVGQRQLVDACPYGAVFYNEALDLPQKCTMCAHLLDRGWKEPRCVEACMTEALWFGEEAELSELLAKAEVSHPEYGTAPRVYYIGLPKRFIAGAVLDPAADECVEGATVIATDTETGTRYTVTSDNYGDFWLKGLDAHHTYTLAITAAGYRPKRIDVVSTAKDVNLGDIPLSKTRT